MSYNIVCSYLNSEDRTLLSSLSNDRLDKPTLLEYILDIISDDGAYIKHIEREKVLSLYRLLKEYYDSAWGVYLDSILGGDKLDKLINYASRDIYYVDAANGHRVATVNEINNGVMSLSIETTYFLDKDIIKMLNLLLWTFSGKLRYYKAAGFDYTYENNHLVETPYQLIFRAGIKLRELVDWLSERANYERAIAVLKLAKKNSKYRYPSYAGDEIVADIDYKHLIFRCKEAFKYGTKTSLQYEVNKLIYRVEHYKYKLQPLDISNIRKAYIEIQSGVVENPLNKVDNEIIALCEKLESGANNGLISKTNFAFKIIEHIKKYGKCSDKQKKALLDGELEMDRAAIKVVGMQKKTENNKCDMDELFELSEALGTGDFEG